MLATCHGIAPATDSSCNLPLARTSQPTIISPKKTSYMEKSPPWIRKKQTSSCISGSTMKTHTTRTQGKSKTSCKLINKHWGTTRLHPPPIIILGKAKLYISHSKKEPRMLKSISHKIISPTESPEISKIPSSWWWPMTMGRLTSS